MSDRSIFVHATIASLHEAAAERVVDAAEQAVAERGVFHLVLAGGSTPRALYERLGKPPFDAASWDRTHFWFGDERCVPPSHEASNFRTAWETWLRHVSLDSERLHRMQGEQPARVAARSYTEEILHHLGPKPRFDVVLLGLGDDGHTASLFPGGPELDEEAWVLPTTSPKPPPERISLGLTLLNRARLVLFLVAGAAKRGALRAILEEGDEELPAARVRPEHGSVSWLIDRATEGPPS